MKKVFLILAIALLAACGQKIEGTYINDTSGRGFTFQSDGTVIARNNTGKAIGEQKYTVEGNQIKFGSFAIFKISADGSLDGGSAHGRYVKK